MKRKDREKLEAMLLASAQKTRRAMAEHMADIEAGTSSYPLPLHLPAQGVSPRLPLSGVTVRHAICAALAAAICCFALIWIPPVKASIQRGLQYIYDDYVIYCYPTSPEYNPNRLKNFKPPLPQDQYFVSRRLDVESNYLQVNAGNDSGASYLLSLYPNGEAQVHTVTRYSHLYQEEVEGSVVNLYAYYEPFLEESPTGEFNAVWECQGITFNMRLKGGTQEEARSLIRATIEAFLAQP